MRMNADAVTVSVQDKKHFAKKKKRALLLALSLLLIIGIVGIFAYMTSYIGAVNKGNKALERNDYTEAEDCFRNAMAKDDTRPEAYTGLSKVYQAQDNTEKAERLFSDALKNRKIISNYIVRASNSISVLSRKRRFRSFWIMRLRRSQMNYRNM